MRRVTGILLAAGSSRRFGSAKLLAPLADGTSLCVAAARKLAGVLPGSLAVVRPEDKELAALLSAQGLHIVECAQAQQGMGHSLAAGVAGSRVADAWLIALADMPYIENSTFTDLATLLVRGSSMVAPYYHGQRGHPVGFAANHGPALLALTGDTGASGLLARHAMSLTRVEVDDPGILFDVDTPADLCRGQHLRPGTATS